MKLQDGNVAKASAVALACGLCFAGSAFGKAVPAGMVTFDGGRCTAKIVRSASDIVNETKRECDGDTDPSAKLYAIDGTAGGAITPLARAVAPGVADGTTTNLTSSFPKWNPFVFKREASGGRLAWLTFSSTRKYGLRSPPGDGTLLWMVAVDLDAPAGTDPSAAAFALPFQDLATSNHIAQWTTQVVPPLQ